MNKHISKLKNIQEANTYLEQRDLTEKGWVTISPNEKTIKTKEVIKENEETSSMGVNSVIDFGSKFIQSRISDENDPDYEENYNNALRELKRFFDYTLRVLDHSQILKKLTESDINRIVKRVIKESMWTSTSSWDKIPNKGKSSTSSYDSMMNKLNSQGGYSSDYIFMDYVNGCLDMVKEEIRNGYLDGTNQHDIIDNINNIANDVVDDAMVSTQSDLEGHFGLNDDEIDLFYEELKGSVLDYFRDMDERDALDMVKEYYNIDSDELVYKGRQSRPRLGWGNA